MSRLPATSVFVLCVFVAAVSAAAPQKKSQQRKTTDSTPSATNPSIQVGPVEPSRPLPKFYVGSPIELVYAMFVGGPPRGEFETSAEYEKRRADSIATGVYPFVLADVALTYDADAGHFTLNLPVKTARLDDSGVLLSAFEAAKVLSTDSSAWLTELSAVARDASVPVYNIILDKPVNVEQLLVPMARDEAREAKPHLRVLAMVHLDGHLRHDDAADPSFHRDCWILGSCEVHRDRRSGIEARFPADVSVDTTNSADVNVATTLPERKS